MDSDGVPLPMQPPGSADQLGAAPAALLPAFSRAPPARATADPPAVGRAAPPSEVMRCLRVAPTRTSQAVSSLPAAWPPPGPPVTAAPLPRPD